MADYIPSRDQDLAAYAQNFSSVIAGTPAAYGLTIQDSDTLASFVSSYVAALATATNPLTRTKPTIAAKNEAKAAMVADLRSLAARVQAFPSVTDAMRLELGLTVRDHEPSPVPVPASYPVVSLAEVGYGKHVIRLASEETAATRAKPEGVDGAEVLVFVGENPPEDLSLWQTRGLTTRTSYEVAYNPADTGKTAHIRARWYNPRGQTGPVSPPISGTIAA